MRDEKILSDVDARCGAMSNQSHTPTVSRYDYWALFSNERPLVGYESLRSDANIVGYRIGNDENVLCDCKTEEQAKAICAAVNSHAALVESLEWALRQLDHNSSAPGYTAKLATAFAALAAAQGGV